jgi:hypothetical protein
MVVNKEDVKVLLNRRKEIQEEVNKLQEEYSAIGRILEAIIRIEERETDDGR